MAIIKRIDWKLALLWVLPVLVFGTLAIAQGVDDAAFGVAKSKVSNSFLFDDTSPDSVDEGDQGIGRMSANRNQYVTIRDGAGNERGAKVTSNGEILVQSGPLVWDSDNAANCAAITATSAQLTLDTDSDYFRCCAWGNSAYAITGANPTATTTVTTGFSFIIGDGQCHDLSTADAKIAVIGTAAAGNYCCISLETP